MALGGELREATHETGEGILVELGVEIGKMTMVRSTLAGLTLALALVISLPAVAQDHVDLSMDFIATVTDDAVNSLTETGLSKDELEERLRIVLVENLAINIIGRFVLGRNWTTSTDQEKAEFLQLFREVTVRAWSGRLGDLGGQRFTVIGAKKLENPNPNLEFALVRTNFGRGDEQLVVEWQVAVQNNVFKVTDVVVSGVSLVQAQRDEFSAVLRQNDGSVSALNDLLRERRVVLNN